MLKQYPWRYLAIIGVTLSPVCIQGGDITLKFKHYRDNNDVQINQPSVLGVIPLTEKLSVRGHFQVDGISAASRRAFNPKTEPVEYEESGIPVDAVTLASDYLKNGPIDIRDTAPPLERDKALLSDAVTGASTRETRRAGGAGVILTLWKTLFNFDGSHSREADYRSWQGAVGFKKSVNQGSTRLKGQYSRFEEQYRPPAGSFAAISRGYKALDDITLSLVQTLNIRTECSAIWNMSATNYLNLPWNSKGEKTTGRLYYPVRIDLGSGEGGMFYYESYPDTKLSHAGAIGIRTLYNSFYKIGTVGATFRRYWDTWGVSSNTITLEGSHYLASRLFLNLQYRFYSQTMADFYRDRYSKHHLDPNNDEALSYRTVDPRLSPFDAHLVKGKLVLLLPEPILKRNKMFALIPVRWEAELQYYNRGTHQDPFIREQRYEFYDEHGLKAWLFRTGLVFSY